MQHTKLNSLLVIITIIIFNFYLDLCLIFLLLRFNFLTLFFLHLALMFLSNRSEMFEMSHNR